MFLKKVLFTLKHVRMQHNWVQPVGYDTGIKVFNCVANGKVPFIVRDKNYVTWYTCGPTVYDDSHIGHASSYVKFDILQRVLREHFDLNVVSVMNITDVDDKIIRRANELNSSIEDLTRKYERDFFKDLEDLHVKPPDKVLRVTECMDIIINYIHKLVDNGQAYLAADRTIYFDVEKYKNVYGKLVNLGENAAFAKSKFKKNPADFALWKAAKPDEPSWKSNYGNGRPGWHIECSAIASNLFGKSIDVHAGGIDLRFPHHENEEAQSCAYFDCKQWVNYWLHTGHLSLTKSEKMSKSLKNTVSIQEMLKSTDASVFRMACLMSHYRHPMEFSSKLIVTASNYLSTYKNFLAECKSYKATYLKANLNEEVLMKHINETEAEINEALRNDFDTSGCIKSLNKLVATTHKMMHSAGDTSTDKSTAVIAVENYVVKHLNMFGVSIKNESYINYDFGSVMDILTNFRHDIREIGLKTKDKQLLEMCDSVRDEIRKSGIIINDMKKNSVWCK